MRIRSASGGYAAVIVTALAITGCSSSSSSPSEDVDASTQMDSGTASDAVADTGAPDAPATPVNGCGPTQFAASDHSAASDPRAISFATTSTPVQFSPNCMSIKAGQTVTWNGDFTDHPLEPTTANTNPIMDVTSGTTTTVTFPAAGVFGYDCANHPSIMLGAIQVVP
jgi:plastocyanin